MISSKKIKYAKQAKTIWICFLLSLLTYLAIPYCFSLMRNELMYIAGYVIVLIGMFYLWHKYKYNTVFTDYVMDGHKMMPLHGFAMFGVCMAFVILFLPTTVNCVIALESFNKIKWQTAVFSLTMGIVAGIGEEIIFRGYLFAGYLKTFKKANHPLLWSGLLTAFTFGFTHFINLSHQSLNATLTQVFMVSYVGVLIIIVRIYTNSIYFGMFYHVLQDFSAIAITHGNISNPSSGKYLPYIMFASIIGMLLFAQCLRGMDNQMLLFRRYGAKPEDYEEFNEKIDFDERNRVR